MKLSEEHILKYKLIPTDEIINDIKDTEREIEQFEKEISVLRNNPVENKLDIYLREGKILKRKDFVETLNCIINYMKK